MAYCRRRKANRRTFPEWTPCGYCYQEWATVFDHIIPVARGGKNNRENLEPACERCNRLLGCRVFDSLKDKKEWLRGRLIRDGLWKFASEEPAPGERTPSCNISIPVDPPPLEEEVKHDEATRQCQQCGEMFRPKTNKDGSERKQVSRFCSEQCDRASYRRCIATWRDSVSL